ncbi:MAG: HEAT repeat domain-containing protein [Gemmatimonadaceae bacterium]|nr:HEAT repeat domain-containing protein [Chitinophagaceae bacterium]
MGFYQIPKDERAKLVSTINGALLSGLQTADENAAYVYFNDEDTYIRKAAYLAIGKIYFQNPELQARIFDLLRNLFQVDDFRIRQTVVNAAGEIGKKEFELVRKFFDKGLFDTHHSVRNAVIGSIKKMGEVNPGPVLEWARTYLHHEDKEIRREICHGIELRGRKHPADILPLLKELQHEKTARVRSTLVHVLGQIAYKKGCLEIVITDLKTWENNSLVKNALEEIIDVHHRYREFSTLTQEEARSYIQEFF